MNEDEKRELEKVLEAVHKARVHHELNNEANAQLHLSDKVLYSPLTGKLQIAEQILNRLIDNG